MVEDHSRIAGRQVLLRAIGDRPLRDPGDEVLFRDRVAVRRLVAIEEVEVADRERLRFGAGFARDRAVTDLDRVDVVDRNAILKARLTRLADGEQVREDQRMAGRPIVAVLARAFEQTPLHDAEAIDVERDLPVLRGLHHRRLAESRAFVVSEPRV